MRMFKPITVSDEASWSPAQLQVTVVTHTVLVEASWIPDGAYADVGALVTLSYSRQQALRLAWVLLRAVVAATFRRLR